MPFQQTHTFRSESPKVTGGRAEARPAALRLDPPAATEGEKSCCGACKLLGYCPKREQKTVS